MHLLDLRKKAEEQWKKEDMELEERLVDFRLQREDAKKVFIILNCVYSCDKTI